MSRGPSAIGSPYHRFIAFIPIPILLILAVALFLRLYQLDLIDVRFDEASALQSALAIARGQFVAVAPYSGSVANHPPVYLYVMALPYLFTRNLLVVAGFRALLDVLAIGLTYGLCVRYFNRRVALVCALFYTLSPWAIQLARKTWLAPLPVWGVLLLWGLLEVTQRHNPRAWVLTGLALALAIGTHLSAIYLLPVVLAVALWQRQTLHWRPVLLGVLPCVLLAAFYLGYDAQHGFANLRAVLAGGAAVGKPEWSLNSMRFAFWLSGGAHLSDLTGPAFGTWQAHWSGWLSWIDTLQMMVLGAFFGLAVVDWRNGRGKNASLVLALWFMLPVLLLLRPTQPLQLHYLLPLYPVQFVMMGWVAGRWMSNARRLTPVIGGLLAVVLVWQLATTLRFNDFVALQNTAAGGYSEPARTGLAATQLARAGIWDGSYADVIVVASGGDPQVNEAATVMDVFLAEVPHRFVDADAGLVLRGEPTQYVFAPGSELALNRLTQLLPPGDVVTQAFKFRADDARMYVLARVRPVALDVQRVALGVGHWANGVDLIGYRAQRSEHSLHIDTFASVTQAPAAGSDYHWFAHVLSADGRKIGQLDNGGVHPNNWRVGDVLWHWYDIPLPAASRISAIRIGSYRYPGLEPVPLLDVAGNPSADSVELPAP